MNILKDLSNDLCEGLHLLSNNTYHMSTKDVSVVVRMLHSVAERLHGEILYAEDISRMAESQEYRMVAKAEAESYLEEKVI
jgi:hypothetical protein